MAAGVPVATVLEAAEQHRRRRSAVLDERTQDPPAYHVLVDAPRPADVDGTGAAHRRVDDGRQTDGKVTVEKRISSREGRVSAVDVRKYSVVRRRRADEPSDVAGIAVEPDGGIEPEDGSVFQQDLLQ